MADAKASFRGIVARIRKATTVDTIDSAQLQAMGEFAADVIVRRTQLGYGVPDGQNGTSERFDLKELAPSTIAARKRMSDRGQLSELTTPGRSNLTATGQMLGSIAVTSVSQGSFTLAPTGTRREGGPTNAQVASYVSEAGRPFLGMSANEFSQLLRFFRNTFGDLLRNNRIT